MTVKLKTLIAAFILIFGLSFFQEEPVVKYIIYALSAYLLYGFVIGTISWWNNRK